ncbi:MAG: inosose dehydratase [Mycobacteriales bacterium]
MDLTRVAGAPISWGVCEVPGWGYQLGPGRVLAELAEVGLAATEFGPDGFLPADPLRRAALLAGAGLRAVGGFVPVVLHEPGHDPLAGLGPVLADFVAAGAGVLVLAADTGVTGYDRRVELDVAAWGRLLSTLDRIDAVAAASGLLATLHPHVGTVVEREPEVRRVLDGCGIGLCLDTGHLLVGGTDPAALAAAAAGRVGHVHLKDVDAGRAARVGAGAATYTEMVADGMYRPLGAGDAGIAAVVSTLERSGYTGWYVLEQDAVLAGPPAPGAGPIADVRSSVDFLRRLDTWHGPDSPSPAGQGLGGPSPDGPSLDCPSLGGQGPAGHDPGLGGQGRDG